MKNDIEKFNLQSENEILFLGSCVDFQSIPD